MGTFPRTEVKQAHAEKTSDGPLSADQVAPTLIMFAVAMLAGALSFYRRWKLGKVFTLLEFFVEIVTAGFCGVVFYWIFLGLGANEYLSAAGCAIVGHMGSRSLFLGKKIILGIFKI